MIVENQKIKVRITNNNLEHYRQIGIDTNIGDTIFVDPKDLVPSTRKKVDVICDYCGCRKTILYSNYVKSIKFNGKYSCTGCVGYKCSDITRDKRVDGYIQRLNDVCKENNYTLLTGRDEIKNNKTYIKYCCPEHGVKTMRIGNFLSGKRCPDCAIKKSRERYQLDSTSVTERFNACGGTVLNPDEYINRSTRNMKVLCPECGGEFMTSLVLFTQHGGQVCPKCSKHGESIGEKKVRIFLEEHGIQFKQEYWFDDCRDVNPLPFDFYLPDLNTIIEFDGRQHYGGKGFFKHSVEMTPIHDEIKNEYCKKKNINLIRIPYCDINKVKEILSKEILHKDIV